jgi:hypothetical protein
MNLSLQTQTMHTAIDVLSSALIAEAEHRRSKPLKQWIADERLAMWSSACDFARQQGLRVPRLDEVELAERLACGHVDYARKWSLGIAEAMFGDA